METAADARLPDLPEATQRPGDPFLSQVALHRDEARAHARAPEAALPLLRAHALRDRLGVLAPLSSLFGELVDRPGVHPEVRALARFLLAQVERSRGRLPRAAEQSSKLGFFTRFHLAGPFDNEGKRGCDTAYPPETSVDLSARFPGKAREISWRLLPDVVTEGYVDLGALMRPTQETAAYALAVVESPSDQRVVLHIGASGASRLWVNGAKVFADEAYHPPRFDQSQVAVNLRKGPNRVLFKVCQDAGPFGFYLRASGKNGEPLDGLVSLAPETIPPLQKGAKPDPELLPTLVEHFRKRAEQQKDDPRALRDYAEILAFRRPFDSKDRRDKAEAARAARLAPKDVDLQLLAARTEDDDHNERRQFLEAAVAADPTRPDAALALADHLLFRGYPRRALSTLAKARAKHPSYYPLVLAEARAYDDLWMSVRATKIVEGLHAAEPHRFEVVKEAARLAKKSDRLREAVTLRRVVLSLRFDDQESRHALSSMLADLGEVEAALKERRELDALRPVDALSLVQTGELAAANDLPEEARRAFARARELLPDEAEVFEREGKALARMGERDGAVDAFERALALKPQNPQIKEALKALRGEEKGFGEEHAYDVAKLVAAHKPIAGEDAVILVDMNAVKVFASGLATRYVQLVERVQTARGVEAERNQWITYSPDRQELKILRTRIVKADGSIIESHTESERSLSDSASRLYYDARARIIGFPNLSPGDVLELAYRLEDTANDNLLSDYFGDIQGIQGTSIKENFDYLVSAPKGRPLYANATGLDGVQKVETREPDGATLYRWSARRVPRLTPEPGMPGFAEVAPILHVSTYKDWDAVGRYYWGLVRDQLVPTDEIKATLKELSSKVPAGDELALVRAVYGFVVSRTRYVGLEFGIHGYKPYKVDKILSRRFGDCKDKASLMHALLSVAGIDSRLVLLRMRRMGKLSPAPASLSAFNHAILYVPKFDLWLDGTAEFFGSRELPTEDREAVVLVVDPGGGSQIGVTPPGRAEDNVTRSEYEVLLSGSGVAQVTGRTSVSGVAAPDYRRAYQAAATRKQTFEQAWARSFPGLSVKGLELSDLTELETDVQLRFSLEVPRYAQVDGERLSFSPFGEGRTYVESYAPLSARKQDLVLAYPWVNFFTYRYSLPAGMPAQELPSDVDVKGPFGTVSLTYRKEGDRLVAEGQVKLDRSKVSAQEYPEFRRFMGEIDQALARKVKIGGAGAKRAGR